MQKVWRLIGISKKGIIGPVSKKIILSVTDSAIVRKKKSIVKYNVNIGL